MKNIKYILWVFAILFIWSCDTSELVEVRAVSESEMESPILNSMGTVVIDQNSYDNEETLTFNWTSADFGYPAAISYALYLSSETTTDYELAANINSSSYTIDHQALYDKLVGENNLGLPTNQVSSLSVYVTATVGSNFTVIKSDIQSISFDIAKIGLDGDLLQIAGEFNGWSTSGAAIVGNEKVYSGYVNMNWKDHESTKYKFVDFVYSTAAWGDWFGGTLDELSPTGGDITITPGMKHFDVDLNTNTAKVINFTKIGLTGLGGWATPSMEMEYDYTNEYYWIVADAATTDQFRILCYSPEDTGWGWSYTMGPRVAEDLIVGYDSDVKIFDTSISKPLLGKDPNMKVNEDGTFKFILYYTATDATWHFRVERP